MFYNIACAKSRWTLLVLKIVLLWSGQNFYILIGVMLRECPWTQSKKPFRCTFMTNADCWRQTIHSINQCTGMETAVIIIIHSFIHCHYNYYHFSAKIGSSLVVQKKWLSSSSLFISLQNQMITIVQIWHVINNGSLIESLLMVESSQVQA